MYQLRYRILLNSPIIISSNTSYANLTITDNYIPGSMILGAFAWNFIRKKNLGLTGHEDQLFYKFFIDNRLKFLNAHLSKIKEFETVTYYPTPFSIQNEKNNSYKIYDLLSSDVKKQTRRINGLCSIKGNNIALELAEKALNFHHANKRESSNHRTGDKLIFYYESLNEEQLFQGSIIGSKDDLDLFCSIFEVSSPVNLGKSKSNQYGNASIEFLTTRPEKYDQKGHIHDEKFDSEFILTLLSHTVIYNKNGFSVVSEEVFKDHLCQYLNINSENLEIENSFIRDTTIENYISVWKMKKPAEKAFKAGSCFRIRVGNINDEIKLQLINLEKSGIGEHTNNGFGQIIINWQKTDVTEYNLTISENVLSKRPEGTPPIFIQNIIRDSIINQFKKKVIIQAMNDTYEFRNQSKILSKSLLYRLENILRKNDSYEIFITNIKDKLNINVKKQLKKVRNNKITLYDYITSQNRKDEDTFLYKLDQLDQKLSNEFKELYEISKYNPVNDCDLKNKLSILYWKIFLNSLQKYKEVG